MDVYKNSISWSAGDDYEVVVEAMDLKYSPSKKEYLKRPFVTTMPKGLTTAASLYQEGVQLKDARKYSHAKVLLKNALRKILSILMLWLAWQNSVTEVSNMIPLYIMQIMPFSLIPTIRQPIFLQE
ncbi:MAG: hypothetical protein IPJ37_13590 [Bacteroidales bacterium]|nr:hypothetical protein [Bacteroidales bacterium]